MSFTDANSSFISAIFEFKFGKDTQLDLAPITNIFAQNPRAPTCFDVLLSRNDDPEDTAAGTFLIAEHLDGYEAIANQPKLYKQFADRWTVTVDKMSVNGKPFAFAPSSVPGIPAGKVAAILDTGFSNPPIPPAAVDAIYSSIPGAVNVTDPTNPFQWLVPCNGTTNLTFTLG